MYIPHDFDCVPPANRDLRARDRVKKERSRAVLLQHSAIAGMQAAPQSSAVVMHSVQDPVVWKAGGNRSSRVAVAQNWPSVLDQGVRVRRESRRPARRAQQHRTCTTTRQPECTRRVEEEQEGHDHE